MTSINAKQEALLDELLKDYPDPQDLLGEQGLLKRLTQRVVERCAPQKFICPVTVRLIEMVLRLTQQ